MFIFVSWEFSYLFIVNIEERNGSENLFNGFFYFVVIFWMLRRFINKFIRIWDGGFVSVFEVYFSMRNFSVRDESFVDDCGEIMVLIIDFFKKGGLVIIIYLLS